MKKYYYILLLCLIPSEIYSQDYYPLQKSNLWNYSIQNSIKKVYVLSDTIFTNGKHYFVLNGEDIIGGKYVRVDSQFVYYYDIYHNLGNLWKRITMMQL